jgi:hypothetical protein
VRHIFERYPGPNEGDEGRRSDVESALARGDKVSHLVEKDQRDETARVRQTVNPGISENRKKHGATAKEDRAELTAGE